MENLSLELGPLNPGVADLVFAVVTFAVCYAAMVRLLRRINRVLAEREDATDGARHRAEQTRAEADAVHHQALALLAEARHDAADIRRRAHEHGAALVAEARADGMRRSRALLADSAARIQADRAAAERELRRHVPTLAEDLAGRVLGEPVAPARTPTAKPRRAGAP